MAGYIGPGSFITVSGPCRDRSDFAFVLNGHAPGVAVPATSIRNNLSGSFCIGLLVNTEPANVIPVVTFYNESFMAYGEITVTSKTISFSHGDSSAVFTVANTRGFKRFQTQNTIINELL